MPRDGLRLEAGEARDAVVLVHDDVAGAQVGERAAARRGARGPSGRSARPAAEQAVLGQDRELQPAGDEAVAQARLGEAQLSASPSVARATCARTRARL